MRNNGRIITEAICFKKEKIKGKYRYHFFVLDEKNKEVTRFGIESKTRLKKEQINKKVKARLKKIQRQFYDLKI